MTSRIVTTTIIALVAALAPLTASASGGEGGGAWAMIWQVLNFILLVAVLYIAARKPIVAFFADRHEQIKDDIDEASELLSNAETRFTEWQRKLVDLDRELDGIRATARERAEEERARIIADAEASAERIQREATAAVEQELRRAKTELSREASELSVELAAQLLREQVSDRDRERLMDEFISNVERSPSDDSTDAAGR